MIQPGCRQEDHPRISRRELLRAGGLSLFGVGLADLLRLEAQAVPAPAARKARSVVFIFQSGGPSQHETFDPKPDAPDGIRGEYGITQTRLPGVHFCEYLPRLAARADRFSIVRTMHHPADRQFRNEHNSCSYPAAHRLDRDAAGRHQRLDRPAAGPGRFEWPSIGSLIAYAAPPDPGVGPARLCRDSPHEPHELPRPRPRPARAAVRPLGRRSRAAVPRPRPGRLVPQLLQPRRPQRPRPRPGQGAEGVVGQLELPRPELPPAGPGRRRPVARVRREPRHAPGTARLAAPAGRRRAPCRGTRRLGRPTGTRPCNCCWRAGPAGRIRSTCRTRPERTRDLYGREEWGQGFLVARRLVEAGVRMVQVNLRGWDTHQNAFRDLKGKLLPSIDHCLSGFLDDLEARGLLDETLVVMCGEMGRTPRISPISRRRQERLGRGLHARPAPLGRRLPLLLRRRRHPPRPGHRPDRPAGRRAGHRGVHADRPRRDDLPPPGHRPRRRVPRHPGPALPGLPRDAHLGATMTTISPGRLCCPSTPRSAGRLSPRGTSRRPGAARSARSGRGHRGNRPASRPG